MSHLTYSLMVLFGTTFIGATGGLFLGARFGLLFGSVAQVALSGMRYGAGAGLLAGLIYLAIQFCSRKS